MSSTPRMTSDELRKALGLDTQPVIRQVLGRNVRGSTERIALEPDDRTATVTFSGLPMPTNGAYKIITIKTKAGKRAHTLALTKEARAYKRTATEIWSHKRIRDADEYAVHIVWMVPDFKNGSARRIDIDGMVKQAMDAAFAGLGKDDAKVARLEVSKVRIDCNKQASHTVSVMATERKGELGL